MKKNVLHWMLMTAMFFGLNMGITSCSDDDKDDNGGNGSEKTEEQYQQEQLGWDIITQLTDERVAPDGWENKTFEPTIGTAKEGDPYTRVVMTNDVETAASRYSDLIGTDVNPANTAYNFSMEGIGSLNYQRGSENDEYLAQVTVDIKQMPHLKKILYQTERQAGMNATVNGTAYYRFGDVVQDADGYYWICVRPSFGPEGKGESHWISVSDRLPEKNLYKYEYKGKSWAVPTGLGCSKEHMQNLAELLFAMLKPSTWFKNLRSSSKPAMFHDFSTSRIQYHNINFWEGVCRAWENNDLFNTLFKKSKIELLSKLNNEGVNFVYNGYSWYTKTSWNCQLFEATYKNGTGKQANMHDATYTKPTQRMEKLNVNFSDADMSVNGDFFNNDSELRVIVRYKTGKQLSTTGVYDPKTAISGCTDVYVYNKYFYGDGYDLNNDPEETASRGYFIIGDVVKDKFDNRWICIQDALYADIDDSNKKWAYFISFDAQAINKPQSTKRLYNLPSKNLAMQSLFALETLYHNYTSNITDNQRSPYKQMENIKTHTGVDLYELVGSRDTIFSFQGNPPGNVICSFVSTLYYNQSDELCVLRLIADYTATQANGGRDWSWHFFDSYTSTLDTQPVEMKLSDLSDLNKISQYHVDRWVMQPWYDLFTKKETPSRGYRNQEIYTGDLQDFIYKPGRSWLNGTVPSNMYDEPIIIYSVQRVLDTGKAVSTFEDGTQFQMVNNMDAVDLVMFGPEWHSGGTVAGVYIQWDYQRFLNEKRYDFGINNPVYNK